MRTSRIKTDWASLALTQAGAIICVKNESEPSCICFNSAEELARAIGHKDILVKNWAVAVPRDLCILKSLVLPTSDLAEAAKMVEFELASLVPMADERIVYGCTLLNKEDDNLNVLVCILKQNALDRYLEPYRKLAIEPARIILDSLAIQNWVNTAHSTPPGLHISTFVNKTKSLVLTGIDGDLQKVSEPTLSGFDAKTSADEIVQLILHHKEEASFSQNKQASILLSGTEEYTFEIKKLLSTETPDCKVVVIDKPSVKFWKEDGYENKSDSFGYESLLTIGLLDLAITSKLPYSNLIGQQYLRKIRQKAFLFNCLLGAGQFLLLIIMIWLCLKAMNWRIEKKTLAIEAQIAPIKHIAGNLDSKRQRVKAIMKQLSNRGQITQIIRELYEHTPSAISISELSFTFDHSKAAVNIKGQADQLSNAFEYTDAMRKSELLSDMQIIDAQQIPRAGGSVVEFKANCITRIDESDG